MTGSPREDGRVTNAMTVDVEDYFQVSAFEECIPSTDWHKWPQRVEGNTQRILEIFDRHGIKGTFFVLGWVAEQSPSLIRRIAESGHEIASHGYGHERLTHITRAQFREGIRRTKKQLEDLTGKVISGYRAPSYSIGPDTLWAHEELQQAGYRYSSSIVPVHHDIYGMPRAPRFAFYPGQTGLLEIPITTITLFGRNWPCGGGGYFRLAPFPLFKWAIRRVNQHEKRPGVFYFHPWEIDPQQPRVPGVTFRNRVRHYLNLRRMTSKLELLLKNFRFDRMDNVFLTRIDDYYPVVALENLQFCAK